MAANRKFGIAFRQVFVTGTIRSTELWALVFWSDQVMTLIFTRPWGQALPFASTGKA